MNIVKITVTNPYFYGLTETFITKVDLSDLTEVEIAADECCGQYLDMHHDVIVAKCPDVAYEAIAEQCNYIIEEIKE